MYIRTGELGTGSSEFLTLCLMWCNSTCTGVWLTGGIHDVYTAWSHVRVIWSGWQLKGNLGSFFLVDVLFISFLYVFIIIIIIIIIIIVIIIHFCGGKREEWCTKLVQWITSIYYNKGPRNWQNVFMITRFCYIEVLLNGLKGLKACLLFEVVFCF